jgi:DMSO/TMAO reductase YedYZ molybdopterin-dependent catalytic subunit
VSLTSRRNFLKLLLSSGALAISGSYVSSPQFKRVIHSIYSSQPNALTPEASWYRVQIGPTPHVATSNYSIEVFGDVKNPFSLSYSELLSMKSVTLKDTIQCVSDPNFLRANVVWTGVPLKDVLALAEPSNEAIKVMFMSHDGYMTDIPMWKALEPDTLLAYMADGNPLPADHGSPVRAVVPRWWGYKYAKWIKRIWIVKEDYVGYWESMGYPDIARKG